MIQEILHVISNVPVITNTQPHTDAFTCTGIVICKFPIELME